MSKKMIRSRIQLFSQILQLRVCHHFCCVMKLRLTILLSNHKWAVYLSFIMATFTDIMIAVGICHLLYPGTRKFAG